MLEALGITHVVSVGETLISCPADCDPMYGRIGPNALVNAYQNGKIKVLVLTPFGDIQADKTEWTSWRSGMMETTLYDL
jgi:dual specificity MAP kinase phosphatase